MCSSGALLIALRLDYSLMQLTSAAQDPVPEHQLLKYRSQVLSLLQLQRLYVPGGCNGVRCACKARGAGIVTGTKVAAARRIAHASCAGTCQCRRLF